MANSLYDSGKEAILDNTVDLDDDNLKAVLLDSADYTADLSADANLEDIPAAARVATSPNLSITVTNGTVDSADFTFSSVTGDESELIVVYQDTGSEATSRLLIFFDTFDSGMPVTPNGGDINVSVNASGLFSI